MIKVATVPSATKPNRAFVGGLRSVRECRQQGESKRDQRKKEADLWECERERMN